jgi:hypothetical protein
MRVGMIFAFIVLSMVLANRAAGQGYGSRGRGLCETPALTSQEKNQLVFLREEEKLAHDVYLFLDVQWNLRIFRNIALSEATHFQHVGLLLSRYGVADPAAGRAAGEYADIRFANLYFEFTTKGSASLKDALEVGTLIEKGDIAVVEAGLIETAQPDIKRVYTNLLNGSSNHLDAFETVLEILLASAR